MSLKNSPLTACIVIRHEEATIRRCLESVSEIAQEILVAHDGPCHDRTLDIAREYTDKVFVFDQRGCSEPHRVKLFGMATNEWILQLDGDEYLTTELVHTLPTYIADRTVSVYEIKWMDEYDGQRHFTIYKQVLFQKSKASFIGAINEYIKPLPGGITRRIEEPYINAPRVNVYTSFGHFLRKYWRFSSIQARQYTSDFSELAKWNYPSDDWEPKTRILINRPITMGMCALPLKTIFTHLVYRTKAQTPPTSLRALIYLVINYWMIYSMVYVYRVQRSIIYLLRI